MVTDCAVNDCIGLMLKAGFIGSCQSPNVYLTGAGLRQTFTNDASGGGGGHNIIDQCQMAAMNFGFLVGFDDIGAP